METQDVLTVMTFNLANICLVSSSTMWKRTFFGRS